jgi:hypothetical protein
MLWHWYHSADGTMSAALAILEKTNSNNHLLPHHILYKTSLLTSLWAFLKCVNSLYIATLYSNFLSDIWRIRVFCFLLQPTNAQIYITVFSLYIILTHTWFDTSVSSFGSFRNLSFAKLHKFLNLKLLKFHFHKIIRLKLFGCCWVIQYILCDVILSCESGVFIWLHIQSVINMEIDVWIYGCYIMIIDIEFT